MHPLKRTVAEIEFAIMTGEFRPKQRLIEAELSKRFGVGRGTIRECLRILNDRGLVIRHANKGSAVVDYTAKEITDLYFLRIKLEIMACALAFERLDSKHLQEMIALQKKLKKAEKTDKEVIKIHEAFHDVIFLAADNQFLRKDIKRLITLAGPTRYLSYIRPDRRSFAISQHDEMIRALKDKNRDQLLKLSVQHLVESLEEYLQAFYPLEADALMREIKDNLKLTRVS